MTVSARELRYRLRRKYERNTGDAPMPQHLVMFEVPVDGVRTGLPVRRRIDAVAVGLWAKTGHYVDGFEIKVSRADLLAELRDPEKSEHAIAMCDRWWLVLGDAALLREGDPVPQTWGILAAHGRGLTVVRDAYLSPVDSGKRFVAAMLQASLRSHGACRGLGYLDGIVRGLKVGEERADRKWSGRLAIAEAAARAGRSG